MDETHGRLEQTGCGPGRRLTWGEGDGRPRGYLWEGGFLVIGQAGGEVPGLAHHAIQVFVTLEGMGAIRAEGPRCSGFPLRS